MELAAQRLKSPTFGLDWALASPPDFLNQGPIMLLGKLSSDVGEWIGLAQKHWRVHTNAFTMPMTANEAAGTVTIRHVGDSFVAPGRQMSEAIMRNVCLLGQAVANSDEVRPISDEGTNFSEILEKVRDNMARRLLIDSEMSIERIAGLLDYAVTPPFTLAFKRWTGQTPLNFRRAERAGVGRPDEPPTDD